MKIRCGALGSFPFGFPHLKPKLPSTLLARVPSPAFWKSLKSVEYVTLNHSSSIKQSTLETLIMIQSCTPHILSSFLKTYRFPFGLYPDASGKVFDRLDHCTQHVRVSLFGSIKAASRIVVFLFCNIHQRYEHWRSPSCHSYYQWRHQRSSWRRRGLWQWWGCPSTQTTHCR